MLRNYRKPLIIAAPKIGLKHPKAISSINEMAIG
jgi:probable 2-oxoglutarate dehydrogenase E1 component DHKTD1